MALCSQAISATATKRGCQSLSNIYSTPNKRICLTNGKVPAIGGIGFKDFYYSSSSEEDDSEDEEHASFESIQMRKNSFLVDLVLPLQSLDQKRKLKTLTVNKSVKMKVLIKTITMLFLLLILKLELDALNT